MKKFRNILYLLAALLSTTACKDELLFVEGEATPSIPDSGLGQMVLFSAGNEQNASLTTRATIPYMETEGRFVCTMYYHGNAGATDDSSFDVEDENSRAQSYMKVFDVRNPGATGTASLGNSVYWSRDYSAVTGGDLNAETYKTYGFDPRVEPFYWKNRLPHIFVAYTDYNKLKTIEYQTTTKGGETVPEQGSLFMYPEADGVRKVKTGESISWTPQNGKVTYMRFARKMLTLEQYNEKHALSLSQEDFDALPAENKYVEPAAYVLTHVDKNQNPQDRTIGEGVFRQKIDFNSGIPYVTEVKALRDKAKTDIKAAIQASNFTEDEKTQMIADVDRVPTAEEVKVDGTYRTSSWTIYYDEEKNFGRDQQPEFGTQIDLADEATVIFYSYDKKHVDETYSENPANTFDLTRQPEMNSITDQPDPILAVTKMKPAGATQEANRVRLYFKHQFAQIQVNVQNVEDNTTDLKAENIVKVELLGVTKKGYVFTLPNRDGEAINAAYDEVDVSKLSADQYAENRFGTSFEMFQMSEAEKPSTSLKSFNAIAFGLLQALRITWKEPSGNVTHTVTFLVDKDDKGVDLKHLQSGKRYVYDIRLSRGMLALIRVSIEGWALSKDLNYREDGTISN